MYKVMQASLILALASGAPRAARADVWDTNTQTDGTAAGTKNELMHGSVQNHDLPVSGLNPDVDYYKIGQRPNSSWEVLVDATSGDTASAALTLQLRSAADTTVASGVSVTPTLDLSKSLRWENTSASVVADQTIRVSSNACTTNCVYRIRAFETTYAIPRFNYTGTQVTSIIMQNTANYAISGRMYFWSDAGALDLTALFTVNAKATLVVNSGNYPAIVGKVGSVTIAHNGRYGDLAGKATAFDTTSGGITFDTPMTHRAN
jgi:hypothetical protein